MNKKIIIWAVVIVIILIAGYMLFNNSDNGSGTQNQGDLENAPESDFPALDTNDQVLNEIDTALNELG